MVSKNVTKLVQNLEKKKFRDKYKLFKIEGEKMVQELLRSDFKIEHLFALEEWQENNPKSKNLKYLQLATESEMKSL